MQYALEGFESGTTGIITVGDTTTEEVTSSHAKNGSYGFGRISSSGTGYRQWARDVIDSPGSDFYLAGWVRTDSTYTTTGLTGLCFGVPQTLKTTATTVSGYQAVIDVRNGSNSNNYSFQIRLDDSTTELAKSNLVTITAGTWYFIEVTWDASGNITAKLYDSSMTLLDTLTATDTTYTSGMSGITCYSASSFDDVQFGISSAPTGTPVSYSMDTKQILYAQTSYQADTEAKLFANINTSFDTKQANYKQVSTSNDMRLAIYQAISEAFDTEIQFFSDNHVSYNMDTKIILYQDIQKMFDNKIQWYQDVSYSFDSLQAIYRIVDDKLDTEIIVYANVNEHFDTKQILWVDADYSFDTLLKIFDPNKTIIRTINIQGSRQLHIALLGSRQLHLQWKGGIEVPVRNQNETIDAGYDYYIDVNVSDDTVDLTTTTGVYFETKRGSSIISKALNNGVTVVDTNNLQIKLDATDSTGFTGNFTHKVWCEDQNGDESLLSSGVITFLPN